jgi:hypothetical protein
VVSFAALVRVPVEMDEVCVACREGTLASMWARESRDPRTNARLRLRRQPHARSSVISVGFRIQQRGQSWFVLTKGEKQGQGQVAKRGLRGPDRGQRKKGVGRSGLHIHCTLVLIEYAMRFVYKMSMI